MTQLKFLTQLYTDDPLISNSDAFAKLKIEFPKTKTTQRQLTSNWKYLLRKRGINIPLQREFKTKKKRRN